MEIEDDWEGRIEAVLGADTDKHTDNFKKWREHLLKKLTLPLHVTGIEDFPWEERYIFGGWSQREYKLLKKVNPSYTDVFELNGIELFPYSEDLIADVKRVSDGKVFEIELSWLEACVSGTEAYTILNDYAVWHCNY